MPETPKCARCGREFERRRKGHIYCSRECRYAGERAEQAIEIADPAAVDRLFDPARDPSERVRDDDWYSHDPDDTDDEMWEYLRDLDRNDTVAQRRRWYLALRREGSIA